jgi:cell division cycle 14
LSCFCWGEHYSFCFRSAPEVLFQSSADLLHIQCLISLILCSRRSLYISWQDRLYYCALKAPPSNNKILLRHPRTNKKVPTICFNIDDELIYWNFFLDFGPLNLGQLYRFTCHLNQLLVEHPQTTILFYSSTVPAKRANATYLICAWQVLELKRSPAQAYHGFDYYNHNAGVEGVVPAPSKNRSVPPSFPLTTIGKATLAPLPPFHDASPCLCTYNLTIFHCLEGIIKAKQNNFFDWDNFDVEEYEHYEQVEVRTSRRICLMLSFSTGDKRTD